MSAQHVSLCSQPYSDSHNSPKPGCSLCGSISIPFRSPAPLHRPSLPCSDQSQSPKPTVHLSHSPLSILLSFPLIGQTHSALPNTSLRPAPILLLPQNSFASELRHLLHDYPLVTLLPPHPLWQLLPLGFCATHP